MLTLRALIVRRLGGIVNWCRLHGIVKGLADAKRRSTAGVASSWYDYLRVPSAAILTLLHEIGETVKQLPRSASMLVLLLTLVLSSTHVARAQTSHVAHKSHSGSVSSFVVNAVANGGYGDMGMDMRRVIERVVRLTDTSAVEVSNVGVDTAYHHPIWSNPSIGIDSLRKAFPSISFEGYDQAEHTSDASAPGCRDGCAGQHLTMIGCGVAFIIGGRLWRSWRGRRMA